MMKKVLLLFVAMIFVFSFALPVAASLPNVDLGREIMVGEDEDSSFDSIIRRAGLTISRSQFEMIEEDISTRIYTGEMSHTSLARFTTVFAEFVDEVNEFSAYDDEINVIAYRNRPEYERFMQEYNRWVESRKEIIESGTVKVLRFDIEELQVENEDGWAVFENLHGASLNLLIEIPGEMRGNYDYYVFGATFSFIQERMIFTAANQGNALPVAGSHYVTATLRGLGQFVLVAVPNEAPPPPEPEPPETPLTTADALNVLKHVAGVEELTSEQRTRYGLSGVISTADALRILRTVAGL
jgi:hypothetical protein